MSETLVTPEQIAEWLALAESVPAIGYLVTGLPEQLHGNAAYAIAELADKTVPALAAEVQRLTAIINEFREHPEGAMYMAWRDKADELRAELDNLNAKETQQIMSLMDGVHTLTLALMFYAAEEHWMSLSESGDRSNLVAHGPHFDGTSNGWVEAQSALKRVQP